MNKWRLLLLSIFALLHITTSERDFFDGRYGCYANSPRYLPSDTSFCAYETKRELRFLPEIRQLISPEKYPTFNVRDTEIVGLSRRRQIRDVKQYTRDNEIREDVQGKRNRISTSPSDHIRDKREDFIESSYERSNDLRSNLRRNRIVRYRDTEYQRNIRTASSSRDDYKKKYATRTRFENRDVSRYNSNDRDMRNARNNNREARRKFPEYDALNTQRNRNDKKNGCNYIRHTETYERDVHEEPNLRNLRAISERPNDNDDNNAISQINNRNVNYNARSTRDTIEKPTLENRQASRYTVGPKMNRVSTNTRLETIEREAHVSRFDRRNVNYNARSTSNTMERRTAENRDVRDSVGPKMSRVNLNTRSEANEREAHVSRYDRRNVNYNARSARGTMERRTLENRDVIDNVAPKMNRVNTNTRLEAIEREAHVSRFDRRNVNYNARSTSDTMERRTAENRDVRDNVGPKMSRVNLNTRLEANEREAHVSRYDRRNVNYNARSARGTMERRTLENRDVIDNVAPKINRVNTNTRLEAIEREAHVSRFDRRNVNYNARSTSDTMERRTAENRDVIDNVAPKMNRVNTNTRLEAIEREAHVSRFDRRNVNYNARSTSDTMERRTAENRDVRDNVGPKMSRVNLNTRLEANEREAHVSRYDRRNVNYNARSARGTMERRTLENRDVIDNVAPKINRVNTNTRLEAIEREAHVSRFDRRNVNYNARSTSDTMERRTAENRDVIDNVAPKMNRVNTNTRLEAIEREAHVSRFDRRNVNYNARSTSDTMERRTAENRDVRDNVGPKMSRVNLNTRLEANEREAHVSRYDRRNVNYNARSARGTMERRTLENRDVIDNVAPKMSRVNTYTRLDAIEREAHVSRYDRRNVNYNARSARGTMERRTLENRDVIDNVAPKMNRVNTNTRLEAIEREAHVSRFDRRNVNYNARSTSDTMERRTAENRDVRDNVGPKMSRVNLNTRLEANEREAHVSRYDRRNVNYNARSARGTMERRTLENRDVIDNVAPKMNRVNTNTRLEAIERKAHVSRYDRRNVNYNARSARGTMERRTLENRDVRDNVGPKMSRVNLNTRSEANEREAHVSRYDRRNVNYNARSARGTMERRTLENRDVIDNVAPKMNRVNTNTRLEAIEREAHVSRYDRRNVNYNARSARGTMERRTLENRGVIDNVAPKMNRVNTNTRLEANERETSESRFDRSNVNYNARSNRDAIEKRSSVNRNENRLFNRRHEEQNAHDERRQTKMTRGDTSIVSRGLVTVRNDPQHNERPAAVHKLYENLVLEMKWQYLFYALQAVYICSLIMKMPKCNEQNKNTMWIPTWFTLNEYLKIY